MKWMIASDIHGSEAFCRALLAAYAREGADKLLLLGDILYHGPRNALPNGYAPKAVIELLNAKRRRSSVYAETAMRRSTRWCWIFPSWRIML